MALVSGLIVVLLVVGSICLSEGQFDQLTVGFYDETCPNAEAIVRLVVREAARSDSNMPAVLLRFHFHDCFVEGCDGSILIDNGENAEKNAFGHQGVRGFEVIEKAKAQLEATCHGVVSCADIVALAARDAITLAGGPSYEVPTGRIDGLVSNLSLAGDMPDVGDSIQQLKAKFMRKGLSEKDLVTLSAAHTIGTTACFFMTKRLYNFFPGGGSDPTINPNLLQELKAKCPQNGDVNVRLSIDRGSEETFDIHIMQNIRNGFAMLESDAKLNEDETTSSVIDSYFGFFSPPFGPSFEEDFVESIIKMGQIGIKTSSEGIFDQLVSSSMARIRYAESFMMRPACSFVLRSSFLIIVMIIRPELFSHTTRSEDVIKLFHYSPFSFSRGRSSNYPLVGELKKKRYVPRLRYMKETCGRGESHSGTVRANVIFIKG